ncbi:hypothetical protein AKO1_006198 [Acrasis kona]|uniref:FH2 domain-containing protein n=1 Tax=Acrasis kona TaxID=1008807 RepID=A0AAW2YJ91_9EUKA
MGGPPPPPGMGPPPPPGMGGMPQVVLPKIATYNPKANLRNFHIDSIHKNKINKTIFVKRGISENTQNIKLDAKRIEELFGQAVVEKKAVSIEEPEAPAAVVSVIDSKRAYNVGIQMASLRMTPQYIKEAVIKLDDSKLDQNQLNVLRAIAPTAEEIEQVTAYEGDKKLLAEPDKFFLHVSTIPHLKDRLDCWSFKRRFQDDLSTLKPDIECTRLASIEMQKSEQLFKLFTLILSVSNYLNAKSRYKNTYGFKLDSLVKLRDTKTSDGKSNLLNYIIEMCESDPEPFYTQLTNVSLAKRVAASVIKESMGTMNKSIKQLEKMIEKYESISDVNKDDCFLSVMKPFFEKAKKEMDTLQEKYEKSQTSIQTLVELYDEDKSMLQKPEDLFKKLDDFIEMYKNAKNMLAERKKKEQSELEKKNKQLSASSANNKTPNLLNELEDSMRSGAAFKLMRKKRESLRLPTPISS